MTETDKATEAATTADALKPPAAATAPTGRGCPRRGELWRTIVAGNRTIAVHLERAPKGSPPTINVYAESAYGPAGRAWHFVASLRPGRAFALGTALLEAAAELEAISSRAAPSSDDEPKPPRDLETRKPGTAPSSWQAIQGAGNREGT